MHTLGSTKGWVFFKLIFKTHCIFNRSHATCNRTVTPNTCRPNNQHKLFLSWCPSHTKCTFWAQHGSSIYKPPHFHMSWLDYCTLPNNQWKKTHHCDLWPLGARLSFPYVSATASYISLLNATAPWRLGACALWCIIGDICIYIDSKKSTAVLFAITNKWK